MKTKLHQPNDEDRAFMEALKAAFAAHQHLDNQRVLAMASQFVGMLVAHQDQRKMTPNMAMEIVGLNIETGNASAVAVLMSQPGGSA